jgi:hypothetical protein
MKPAAQHSPATAAMLATEGRETERAAFWALVPPPARIVVMMVAHLPRERANAPLGEFSAAERRHIAAALSMLSSHLDIAKRCMIDTAPAPAMRLH